MKIMRYVFFIIAANLIQSIAISQTSFNTDTQILYIPFAAYEAHTYQAELHFTPPNQLALQKTDLQSEQPIPSEIVSIEDQLHFYLSNIQVNGQQYAADIQYQGNNQFLVSNLIKTQKTHPGKSVFLSNHFSGSGVCAQCHNDLQDSAGTDVSIVSAWETTMMANSTRDPFWQAKLKSELNRTPQITDTINDTCTRCHAPMANVEAKKQHDNVQPVFGEGLLSKKNPYHNLAMNGVSCSLCHQIAPTENFGTPAGFSGGFTINSYEKKSDRLIYGPFKDVEMEPMQQFANFTPIYSEHVTQSEFCASCHELITHYTDEEGNIISDETNGFPEQTPYSEWKYSDFGEFGSCQQCHMERSSGVVIASQPSELETERNGFAQHDFLGANRLMLSILQDNRDALGVVPKDFSQSLKNAGQLLSRAANLEISDEFIENGLLKFKVHVHSETGHKLPSAYPSRRLILHVTVSDQQDQVVFESGKVSSSGKVIGLDSDENPQHYEPHYQIIDSEDKVQVYETIMQDYQGKITYTLLRAKSYLKDNRLLPKGFDKHTVPDIIKVHGNAESDADFVDARDTVEFVIDVANDQNYNIVAELIYQPLGYAFAEDLFVDRDHEISRFKQMFRVSNKKSTIIDRTSKETSP